MRRAARLSSSVSASRPAGEMENRATSDPEKRADRPSNTTSTPRRTTSPTGPISASGISSATEKRRVGPEWANLEAGSNGGRCELNAQIYACCKQRRVKKQGQNKARRRSEDHRLAGRIHPLVRTEGRRPGRTKRHHRSFVRPAAPGVARAATGCSRLHCHCLRASRAFASRGP